MSDDDAVDSVEDIMARLDLMIRSCFSCKRDKRDTSTAPCSFCAPLPKYPTQAPDGQVFVCGACGRLSKSLYGDAQSSWDESCMMNAVLCHESSVVRAESGLIEKADAVEGY
jgi:hypothetical protein